MEKRLIIVLILLLVILITATVAYIKRDTFFITITHIKYANGCEETYRGTQLISPECVLKESINKTLPERYTHG